MLGNAIFAVMMVMVMVGMVGYVMLGFSWGRRSPYCVGERREGGRGRCGRA